MITRTATARYEGFGKDGKGQVSTQSGVLDKQAYGFGSRRRRALRRAPTSECRSRRPGNDGFRSGDRPRHRGLSRR